MERTGDLWDTGDVDITGSLMVLTLKQVAIAHNLSDSYTRADSKHFSKERHLLRITRAPDPLQYLSYIFASGNLLAGPFFEFHDYVEFTARTGAWGDACRREFLGAAAAAAAQCFGLAIPAVVVSQAIAAKFTSMMLVDEGVLPRPMLERYLIAFLTGAPTWQRMPNVASEVHGRILAVAGAVLCLTFIVACACKTACQQLLMAAEVALSWRCC